MKKETMIVTMLETTEILPNCFEATIGIEELKQQMKQRLKAEFEGLGFDDVNITNVKVFEIEKEERISTEDLIAAARHCNEKNICNGCPIYNKCYYEISLVKELADRLEELHNQQTATPTKIVVVPHTCETCKYRSRMFNEAPCNTCGSKWKNWERA